VHAKRPRKKERRGLTSKLRLVAKTSDKPSNKPPANKPGVLHYEMAYDGDYIRCDRCAAPIYNIHPDVVVTSSWGLFCKVRCRTLHHAAKEGGFGRIILKRRARRTIDAGMATKILRMRAAGGFSMQRIGEVVGTSLASVHRFLKRSIE
jgi:hypothetical protein